jgi:prolyl-tRNA editing enzyme YbaK/EbsC (Cys-tRNA(Pro) deacylase)
MRNSEYNEQYSNDPFYPKFIMVIVQYSKKLVPQNIAAIMRQYQRDAYPQNKEKHIGRKFYKFRLAEEEDAYAMSGYKYNAITPFFMNDNSLKIILSDTIVNGLNPGYFWLGGGRVELKMGISVEEFLGYFGKERVIVGNISTQ